ncbi:MAG: recombination regulator RecX [Vibrio sp.]
MGWKKQAPKLSAKEAAIGLLSRRDHGEYELKQKLLMKEYPLDEVESALLVCHDYGYLDDLRYAQIQVRSHLAKGHGKRRITQSLKQNQIAEHIIEQAIDEQAIDWFEQAKDTAQRKFRGQIASDAKAYAKQVRFLQYRGFDFDQIKYALSPDEDE